MTPIIKSVNASSDTYEFYSLVLNALNKGFLMIMTGFVSLRNPYYEVVRDKSRIVTRPMVSFNNSH